MGRPEKISIYTSEYCAALYFRLKRDLCPIPPSVTSAQTKNEFGIVQKFFVGRRVYYECLPGYIQNENTTDFVICQSNLTWSEPLISCIPIDCGDPKDIKNGYYKATGRTYGSIATYDCNKGYQLIGKGTIVCTIDGWNKNIPFCDTILCDPPNPISNGDVTERDSWDIGTDAKYSCHAGYALIGQHSINCTDTGDWSHDSPICKALPDHEEQLSPPSTIAATTIRETTPEISDITTDGGDRNHLLSSLPSLALPDHEEQVSPPSTIADTTTRETTPEISDITTDGGDRNHLLSSLISDTATYEQRQTDLSTTTTVNTIINKTIPPNNSPIPTDRLNESLILSAVPNYSSNEYWKKGIYFGAIPGAIVIVLIIIKVICDRRKYGSYKTGSQFLECHKDTELATIKLIGN
ncbi:complement decay-accelerating factor transmembrane isoform-like isoform X2 [Cetorhinus maximus]